MLLAAALLSQVQVRDAPKNWKKIVTDHFDLYYPEDEFLPRAREFGAWFEEARRDLEKEFPGEIPRVSVFLYGSYHDLLQSSFLAAPPASTAPVAPLPFSFPKRFGPRHRRDPRT